MPYLATHVSGPDGECHRLRDTHGTRQDLRKLLDKLERDGREEGAFTTRMSEDSLKMSDSLATWTYRILGYA